MRRVKWIALRRVVVILTVSMTLASCGILQISIETGEDEKNEHALETAEALNVTESATEKRSGLEINATTEPMLQKATPTPDATHTVVAGIESATLTAQAAEAPALPVPKEDWIVLESQEIGITFQYPSVQQMLEDVSYRFSE